MAPFPSPTKVWHDTTYPSISPTRPELSAKGKAVVVTGGGTGIGAETATYFAKAGATRIALLGRRIEPLLATKARIKTKFADIEVFTASTDVTDKTQVDASFAEFAKTGKIDILISNAAMVGPPDPIENADAEKFLGAVHSNIQGQFLVAQAFLRWAASDAVVIDVNSSAAHLNFGPVYGSYSIAKFAIFRLWDFLAFSKPGLNVFHVQPGIVDTAMNQETGGVKAAGFSDDVSLPASFNVWLASPDARFLRNKFVWANWDVDELKKQSSEIQSGTRFNLGLVGWPFEMDKAGWKFESKNSAWLSRD